MTPDSTSRSADGGHDDEAATFAVLAQCWRDPTPELVAAVEDGALDGVVPASTDVSLDRLRAEYSRLFIGPGDHPCPPYESVYRDRSSDAEFGQVMGASTQAVERWYREFGLALDGEWSDLPDHVATELEFAAHLSAEGHIAEREQFLAEHLLAWADEFLSNVEDATREPFYAALARTTRTVLDV